MQHIGDLRPDPANARRHTSRNVGTIEAALREVGAGRSIVIDENGTVLVGNATIEAAAAAGIEKLQVIDADGETIIAVRRSNLSPEQKRRLALFDNRAAELAEWDTEVLAAMADAGDDMGGLWSDEELAALIAASDPTDFDPNEHWGGMPEFQQDDQMPVKQITVSFASVDDVQRFADLLGQNVTMTTKSIWYPLQPIGRYKGTAYVEASDAA